MADSGRQWPILCSFCFATVCDDLIVRVTMGDRGRLWLTLADCGQLRLTGADSGRQWPTLCSFRFATVFDDVIVRVTDTFWPIVWWPWATVGDCGRLWPTVADCGRLWPTLCFPLVFEDLIV